MIKLGYLAGPLALIITASGVAVLYFYIKLVDLGISLKYEEHLEDELMSLQTAAESNLSLSKWILLASGCSLIILLIYRWFKPSQ